jgi:hypothetical protein
MTLLGSALEHLPPTTSQFYATAVVTVQMFQQPPPQASSTTEAAEPMPPSPLTKQDGTSVVAEAWAFMVLVGLVLVLLVASAMYSSCTPTNPFCSWCHWKKRQRWLQHQQQQRRRQSEQQVALQRMALARQRAGSLRGGNLQLQLQQGQPFSTTSSLPLSEQQRYMFEVELRKAELLRSCILSAFEVNQVQMVRSRWTIAATRSLCVYRLKNKGWFCDFAICRSTNREMLPTRSSLLFLFRGLWNPH